MATKADFTEEEWEALRKGVTGAGLLVSLSDRGFFDTFKETGALASHLGDARKDASSELVRELAQSGKTGFGMGTSQDELEAETLAALRTGVTTLREKAPDELDDYRRFVLEVAESVAAAAGGGDAAESEALAKLRAAVGASA